MLRHARALKTVLLLRTLSQPLRPLEYIEQSPDMVFASQRMLFDLAILLDRDENF